MGKGRYGGPEKRRSPRHERRFRALLEYEQNTYEIRTIDISEHGVLIPRRVPPPIGTPVKVTLIIKDESSMFEGTVVRHTKCYINGVETTGIGVDFSKPEYQEFVKKSVMIT
ncbi:MAG: PilZ domain-containing protein [Thermodesulfovibrionales bacterium]|jgi:hypothetical protein